MTMHLTATSSIDTRTANEAHATNPIEKVAKAHMQHWSAVDGPLNQAFKIQRARGPPKPTKQTKVDSILCPSALTDVASEPLARKSILTIATTIPEGATGDNMSGHSNMLQHQNKQIMQTRPADPLDRNASRAIAQQPSMKLSPTGNAQLAPITRTAQPALPLHQVNAVATRPCEDRINRILLAQTSSDRGSFTWQDGGNVVAGASATTVPTMRGPQLSPSRHSRSRHHPYSPPRRTTSSHPDKRAALRQSSSGRLGQDSSRRQRSIQEMYLEETKRTGRLPTDINCFGLEDDYQELSHGADMENWSTSFARLNKQKKEHLDLVEPPSKSAKIAKAYSTFQPQFVPKIDNNRMILTGSTFKLPVPAFANRGKGGGGMYRQADIEQSSTRRRSLFKPPPKDEVIEILEPEERQQRRDEALKRLNKSVFGLAERPSDTTSPGESTSSRPKVYPITAVK